MQNPIHSRGIGSLGLVVAGALALAVVVGMALTHAAVPDAMWGWHDGMWSDGHMAGWRLGTVLFGLLWMGLLVGFPIFRYWLVTRSKTDDRTEDSAIAVLREQYARGEIDDEEFERRREVLERDTDSR